MLKGGPGPRGRLPLSLVYSRFTVGPCPDLLSRPGLRRVLRRVSPSREVSALFPFHCWARKSDHFLSRNTQNHKTGEKTLEWSTVFGVLTKIDGFDIPGFYTFSQNSTFRPSRFYQLLTLLSETRPRSRDSSPRYPVVKGRATALRGAGGHFRRG